jgi:hypothetical protein
MSSRPVLGPTQPPKQRVPKALSPWVKRPRRELTTHLQLMPKSRKCGSIYPLLHTSLWRSARLVKHSDNFTFTFSIIIMRFLFIMSIVLLYVSIWFSFAVFLLSSFRLFFSSSFLCPISCSFSQKDKLRLQQASVIIVCQSFNSFSKLPLGCSTLCQHIYST